MFYLVNRQDCDTVTIAADIDPRYARELRRARRAGVEVAAYQARVGLRGISVFRPLTFELN